MKNYFIIIVILFTANIIYSQIYIDINKKDGSHMRVELNKIDSLTFGECPSTLVDARNGKTYNVVMIGSQCWMAENLNIGTMINGSNDQQDNSTIEKYCYNNTEDSCSIYGGLYQWAEAVNYQDDATNSSSPSSDFSGHVQGICPDGWHIPTLTEFEELKTFVNNDATKLIDENAKNGYSYTNETGFSALFAGYRYLYGGSLVLLSYNTHYWSSTEDNSISVFFMGLYYNSPNILLDDYNKLYGFSIRCLMD